MLAALLYGQEDLRLEQVAEPAPAAGEVVIQVEVATTCGTDLKVGVRAVMPNATTSTHCLGMRQLGGLWQWGKMWRSWQVGDRVVANCPPAWNVFLSTSGIFSCPNLTWNNGTFAEYLKIPALIVQHNLLAIPAD